MSDDGALSDRAVSEFLIELAEDLAAGRELPLDHYLDRHPGYPDAIRREYASVVTSRTTELEERTTPERVGPFLIEREIGRGGQGIVFRARREGADDPKPVALKVLTGGFGAISPDRRRRFRREAEGLARLDHPGLGRMVDADLECEPPWIAMELVEGQSLAARIARWQRDGLEPTAERERCRLVARLVAGTARALHAAHEGGFIHRDIKPGNLHITPDGDPVLLDFGLARDDTRATLTLTRTDDLLGTPAYLAPELVEGRTRAADARSDIYGLGVTLYEALTLQLPFRAPTRDALYRQILQGAAPPPETYLPELPRGLGAIVRTAMECAPRDRYATAAALADDLVRFLEGRPTEARPPTPWRRARRWCRRHPVATTAASGLLLALLVGLAVTLGLLGVARRERDAKELALGRLEETLGLVDAQTLRSLERRVADLRFEGGKEGDVVDGDVAAWLVQADELLARRADHRASRRELRTAALPYDRAQRQADLEDQRTRRENEVTELENLVSRRRELETASRADDPERVRLESRIAEIEESLRLTWEFEDPADAWRHDSLTRLLSDLEEFTKRRDRVQRRNQLSRSFGGLLAGEHAARWRRVIAAVGDVEASPVYGGLELRPQPGLVPLGADPVSGLQEFAHLHSGKVPERDEEHGRLQLFEDSGIVLVLLPGGTARIGATPDEDPQASAKEAPVHEVSLDPFFMGKHEVTQAQWARLTNRNPSRFPRGRTIAGIRVTGLHPVEWVPWHRANRGLARFGFSLPTEVQWEYAARAGTRTPWPSGMTVASLQGRVNLKDRTAGRRDGGEYEKELDDAWPFHAPIGSLPPNAFGLHEMIGNLVEWCRDADAPYTLEARPGDGLRRDSGERRILRGGSFAHLAANARVSSRSSSGLFWGLNIGFRVARALR